jgi:hypothetical protein
MEMTTASKPIRNTITLAELTAMQKKRSKYGSRKTEYDGNMYDSMAEAKRAMELDVLLKCGKIARYVRQFPYAITVNGIYICTYIVDFRVEERIEGPWWIEDVKGMATPVYKLKAKLFRACYPQIDFREIAV